MALKGAEGCRVCSREAVGCTGRHREALGAQGSRSPGCSSLPVPAGRDLAGVTAQRPIGTRKGQSGRVWWDTPPNRRGRGGAGAGLRGTSLAGHPGRGGPGAPAGGSGARPAGDGVAPPRHGVPRPRGSPTATPPGGCSTHRCWAGMEHPAGARPRHSHGALRSSAERAVPQAPRTPLERVLRAMPEGQGCTPASFRRAPGPGMPRRGRFPQG